MILAFYSVFLNIHWSGVLNFLGIIWFSVTWLVPCETAVFLILVPILHAPYTPYNHSYFGIRSTPCVTAVARKRSRSFCQKCRWQVTAKHAYTLRMWLCMKWHGAWLYGVHRTCAEMAAVSYSFMWHQPCQRCKYTTSVDIQKTRYKKLVTHVEPQVSAVSLLKRAENSAI